MPPDFLADENVPADTVAALRAAGFNIPSITDDSPSLRDEVILARAQTEGRIVLTFDKDFGEMAFHHGLLSQAGVILVRIPLDSPSAVTAIVLRALHSRDDWAGNFSVIEADRIRMTALP